MAGRRDNFCGSPEHSVDRRRFLGAMAAGAAAFAGGYGWAGRVLKAPALAGELKQRQKRVILLWLAGASSQLETWDPKPGTPTGGPFRAIDTNVPGIRISELMPKMARRMDRTTIIRSLNTKNGDHGGAAKLDDEGADGRPQRPLPGHGRGDRQGTRPGPEPGAGLCLVLRPDRGPRLRGERLRLPRLAVLADRADHEPRSPRTSAAPRRSPNSTTSNAPSFASCSPAGSPGGGPRRPSARTTRRTSASGA